MAQYEEVWQEQGMKLKKGKAAKRKEREKLKWVTESTSQTFDHAILQTAIFQCGCHECCVHLGHVPHICWWVALFPTTGPVSFIWELIQQLPTSQYSYENLFVLSGRGVRGRWSFLVAYWLVCYPLLSSAQYALLNRAQKHVWACKIRTMEPFTIHTPERFPLHYMYF